MPAGDGYADIVFLPLPGRDKPAIAVELKYNKTAQTAVQQIKDKKQEGHSCMIECVNVREVI